MLGRPTPCRALNWGSFQQVFTSRVGDRPNGNLTYYDETGLPLSFNTRTRISTHQSKPWGTLPPLKPPIHPWYTPQRHGTTIFQPDPGMAPSPIPLLPTLRLLTHESSPSRGKAYVPRRAPQEPHLLWRLGAPRSTSARSSVRPSP